MRIQSSSEEWGRSIVEALQRELPGGNGGKGAKFEAVVAEVFGTKQHRYGPLPTVEEQFHIREVVRRAMDRHAPIPILVPWGASKQGPWSVDIAEVMGLRQLECMDQRVSAQYAPGVRFALRLEDLTDGTMFEGVPGYSLKTSEYVQSFTRLVRVLNLGRIVTVRLESEMMDEREHKWRVKENAGKLMEAMGIEDGVLRKEYLRRELPEWAGDLDQEHLDFYLKAYERFYPDDDERTRRRRLATYFGGALARFQLGGTGVLPGWEEYLTLAFTGIPWSRVGKRVFYRTMPQRYTNQHRAPWIGKGYLRVNDKGEATPAISGWNGDGLEFERASAVLTRGEERVEVETDLVVEEDK
jgi:hypothetical protein